jgi:hypothetical protein
MSLIVFGYAGILPCKRVDAISQGSYVVRAAKSGLMCAAFAVIFEPLSSSMTLG